MENSIYTWKSYMSKEDYNYLYQFIDNIKKNILNDKMIILVGSERTGKTTLINDIKNIFGKDNYYEDVEEISMEPRQIVLLDGNINYMTDDELQNLKQILECKESVIASTNNLNSVYSEITNDAKIIEMKYKFL